MKKISKDKYLSISEFSKISEVSRKALIFYDNIGLFMPEFTAPNGYRYYAHEQIYILSVINILKQLGMPLSEIKTYMNQCTPNQAIELLKEQNAIINSKITELQNVQNMLMTKLDSLTFGKDIINFNPTISYQEEEPIYISQPINMEKSKIPDEIWTNFYMECRKNGIIFGYPEGFLVSQNNLQSGKTNLAKHIVFHLKDFKYSNSTIPKGRYLIAYGHGGLEETEEIYQNLLQYIRENNIKITGYAYEKRLIDEIATKDKAQQLIQIKVQII